MAISSHVYSQVEPSATIVFQSRAHLPWQCFKGQIRGFQIGPMSLVNIPVVRRNKQKDFGFSGVLNYEVIQIYI
jgi:hypothetical protein